MNSTGATIDKVSTNNVMGIVELFDIQESGTMELISKTENKFMANGADVLAKLLSGDPAFRVQTMYVEYENNSPVSVVEPSYTVESGLDYYTGLSSPKDYLRVPMVNNPALGSSDESKYESNQVTFFGITSGVVGVNGLAFSETAGSTVYGGALIASPDISAPSSDRIFARTYWTDRLFTKHDGRQVGVQWTVRIVAND